MKQIVTTLLLTVLALISTPLYAKDAIETQNMVSPQVADLFRCNMASSSLFTGRMNLSIPIYTLEDPDFPLQIALSYNSEGFKPRKASGFVGCNWFLNAGGCITREVMGYPDERFLKQGDITHYGMLYAIHSNIVSAACGENGIFNFQKGCVHSAYNGASYHYWLDNSLLLDIDYQPDIFHFNFCNHSGTFIIDNHGKATILQGDFVEVDLSELYDDRPNKNIPRDSSQITIKTMDGFTYVFGGYLNALEYNIDIGIKSREFESNYPVINSWYLSEVIAPNGRIMRLFYQALERNDESDRLWQFNEDYLYPPEKIVEKDINGMEIPKDIYYYAWRATKQCLLDSIVLTDPYPISILFHKSVESNKKYIERRPFRPTFELDSIVVKQGENILKSTLLTYEYKNDFKKCCYWRFLSELAVSDIGHYIFTYDDSSGYPTIVETDNGEQDRLADYHGYWLQSSTSGLLQSVVFPTGGKQIFRYEKHRYGTRQYYSPLGTDDVQLLYDNSKESYIGGARIKSIETYDGNMLVEKQEYDYTADGKSSGIYYDNKTIHNSNNTDLIPTLGRAYNFLSTHIGYSSVTEKTTAYPAQETYETTYTFHAKDNPYYTTLDPYVSVKTTHEGYSPDAFFSWALCYNSTLSAYGHLLAKVHKDANHNIVSSTAYQYNNIDITQSVLLPPAKFHYGRSKEITTFSSVLYTAVARKLQIYPDLLEQEVTTTYDNDGNELSYVTCYEYDDKQRIKTLVSRNSDDTEWFTSYSYPDIFAGTSINNENCSAWGWQYLTDIHCINHPVETTRGYYDPSNNKQITSGQLSLYGRIDLALRPSDSIPSDRLDSMMYPYPAANYSAASVPPVPHMYMWTKRDLEFHSKTPVANYTPLRLDGNNIVYDERYQTVCDYRCGTNWQRLYTVYPVGKPTIKYQWQGLYPVSKTIGSQTYTYTYIPYVGVSSITDPRGITTYYNYDGAGRLTEVYQISEGKKQVIQTYYYHYSTQQ